VPTTSAPAATIASRSRTDFVLFAGESLARAKRSYDPCNVLASGPDIF
jgi:hypothetical protein